ncbi:MAG: SDR family oxidoreductase [Hyphomicrobiaceae bacterium]|nr:SDR family oxidoreductase [Hyphomicrobiaceae bacterium]
MTGAAGGLGSAIIAGLLDAGAQVMAADINEKGLAALAEANKTAANALATIVLDISVQKACDRAVQDTETAFGKIDILINNGALGMGIIRDDHFTDLVGIEEIEPAIWDQMVRVNLNGAWYLTRAVVPGMKRRRFGRIVNVTTSMFTMLRGKVHPYGPSKAALEAMSAGHAQEFEPDGITVNVVVPGGPADTAMVPEASGLQRHELIPPSAMAGPIVWLCSDAAAGVTGRRYVAAEWKAGRTVDENRQAAEAPAGWPSLAQAPVWPGGKPKG